MHNSFVEIDFGSMVKKLVYDSIFFDNVSENFGRGFNRGESLIYVLD